MTDIQTTSITTQPRQREAYARIANEMALVPESAYTPINVDVMVAVSTVLGVLPEILVLRPQFESNLPHFDLRRLDQLETYALATMHAQSQYAAASTPPENIPTLVEEAAKMREQFIADVTALGKRGLVNATKLSDLKGTNGFRNTASDLLMLASMLRSSWSRIAGKTPITEADLDHAEILGEQIVTAVGFREQAPNIAADVVVARQRVFTLFMSAYDQIRRGVCYLRWEEDDADDIAPSLYAGRNTKKKPSSDADSTTTSAPAETTAGDAEPSVTTAVPPAAPVPSAQAGLPGASPFLAS